MQTGSDITMGQSKSGLPISSLSRRDSGRLADSTEEECKE